MKASHRDPLPQAGDPAARLVAHRGHAAVCPENTLSAIDSALELGARQVEVDVQLSADGVPHLFHDRTLARMCGVSGRLADLDAGVLESLRASQRRTFGEAFADERIPTLDRAVERFTDHGGAHLYVELKRAAIEEFGAGHVLAAVLPVLEPLAGRCSLISFDLEVLQLAREESDVPVGPVLEAWAQLDSPAIRALEPDVIFCNVKRLPRGPLATPAPLVVYEIDRSSRALALLARGAAGIETFAVGRLLEELAAREASERDE